MSGQPAVPGPSATPRAVLVGLPGAGKTTVGALLARALGVPFLDSDAEIERATGRRVAEIFATDGEPYFRDLEHRTVAALLDRHPGVLALGGGAPLHPGTQAALAGHTVVHLAVSVQEAGDRVAGTDVRPLLRPGGGSGDAGSRLAELARERDPLYRRLATVSVPTDGRAPQEVSDQVLAHLPAPTARVRVPGEPGYDVLVGRGLAGSVAQLLGPAGRALLVHPPALAGRAHDLAERLRDAGREVVPTEVPDAEQAKTVEVAARCWDVLGEHRFGRQDAVVGLGGGATTDLAGFVAATWLRGVRVVQVPTTLLGMVDAAVGGKTGINTPAGKNLVGAFHPPAGVVCDLDTLTTLPTADLRAGFAEVVKCGFIADAHILRLLAEVAPGAAELHDPASPVLAELVTRAVAVKAHVVGQDLRESGLRETLNYGHTLAHAIERTEGYRWRHGDAVSVGMVYAAELARLAGLLPADVVERHRTVLASLGLPTTYRPGRWPELLDAMRSDKKVRADALRFVLLTDVGRPTVLTAPDPALLEAAYAAVSGPSSGTPTARGTVGG